MMLWISDVDSLSMSVASVRSDDRVAALRDGGGEYRGVVGGGRSK